ncbi:MAG TPA: CHAT domain-containing protein, partial [Chitinophagaceae bacterium]|nr:CHAT domain-containing protein [Chitinophagaceae bacterium]
MYDKVSGRKPVVIMLAGIMGSSLGKNGNGIWLNYLKLVMGGLTDLAIDEKGIEARGLIKTSYKKLAEHLSRSFDVVTFPYDWRISVTKSAALLNERMVALLKLNQPIKIIAHSMGGVLAREFILNHPSTWNQLNNSNEFILLLLGTPWMGSYRIPNVLCGRDGIIKSLDTLDFAHSKDELVNLFSKFPGILNLLPTRKEDHDFSQESTWIELQKASGLKWTIPPKSTIAEFGEFRKRVQENESKIDYTHIRYIAGKDDITQMNYRIENGQIQFEATARGDQSVTWDSGIPAKLKNTESVYYSQVTHGGLANEEKLFAPIVQLITTGTTNLLPRTEPKVDTQKKRSLIHLEAEDDFEMNETLALQRILGLPAAGLSETEQLPVLKVSVSNGDLMFSRYPVMLGHFRGDGIVSAERVADTYLKGKLSLLHALGTYPGHAGSLHFEFPEQSEFKGVCVIGIGEIDQLNTRLLSESVEKAAIEYTLHERWKRNSEKETLGLSTLLIGADYGGLGIETSLRAILQGIQAANAKIRALKQENIPLIEEIEFIELFEDRALQCFYSLKKIMSTYSLQPEFEFADAQIRNRPGKRKRLLTENKSDWWQRLTVLTQEGTSEGVRTLRFLSSTNGAREERSDLECNFQLVEHLIESLSTSDQWNPESAKTIFELLVPNSFKENIKRQTDLVWILDSYSASFPWELFQTDIEKSVPLCISAGMIRTLATNAFRSNIIPVNNRNMLIIGDPQTDGYCQPLGGAEKEASEVSSLFENEDYQVKTIIHGHSTDIVTAFFQTEYKMIHLSGHGYYDPQQGISGMVIGNKVFLTPREFNQMSYAPELVFVNCCHLGKIQEEAENL